MTQADAAGIVTPEAVLLELDTASIGSRLLAGLIDLVIQGVAFLLIVLAAVTLMGDGAVVVILITQLLLIVVYPIAFEAGMRGRTPGKAALGLRVVTTEGAPIRIRHATSRSVLAVVETYLLGGFGAVLAILLSRRSQRLGDMVAGTVVVRERTAARTQEAVRFPVPRGMEAYVTTLDPAGLTGADYAAIRSFLLRAPTLPSAVRFDLARRLATPLLARTRHTPPPQVGPEMFLACLAAAYQQRADITWAGYTPVPPARSAPAPSPSPAWQPPPPHVTPEPASERASEPAASPPPPETTGGFAPPS